MTSTKRTSTRKAVDPEARKAEMKGLHDRLTAQVEQLRDSKAWRDYLTVCARMHHYSIGNVMLIWSQMEHATAVAGYRTWQTKGRQVRKGETGIRILSPAPITLRKEAAEGEDEETKTLMKFKPVSVFDISQTEPMEGHEDVTTMTAQPLTGADEAGVLGRVVAYLAAQGVPVTFAPIEGGAQGFTSPARDGQPVSVTIEERNEPAQQAKTAIHEAAHIALGHIEDLAEYRQHRGRCEVEAESVAYVVAGLLGLDTASYSTGYVAGWAESAEPDVLKETAARVLAAVHQIAEGIEAAEAAEAVAA